MIFLVAGMIIFWLVTFLFVWSISRRQHKLEEEVQVLSQVVQDAAEQA